MRGRCFYCRERICNGCNTQGIDEWEAEREAYRRAEREAELIVKAPEMYNLILRIAKCAETMTVQSKHSSISDYAVMALTECGMEAVNLIAEIEGNENRWELAKSLDFLSGYNS